MKKNKRWVKRRHAVVHGMLKGAFARAMARNGYNYQKANLPKDQQYLILSNHQTGMDQFVIQLMLDRPLYFIIRSEMLSKGLVSKALSYLVAPIPKDKLSRDNKPIRISVQVAKEGGSIVLFPEGNRTMSGTTEHIDKSIVTFIKLLKLPVVFINLVGGFGKKARWSREQKDGPFNAYVKSVVPYEVYKDYTNEQIYNMVVDNLAVDDVAMGGHYKGQCIAEYMECMLFVCPKCGLAHFNSHGDTVECCMCHRKATYGEDLRFAPNDFNMTTVKQWFDYQKDYIRSYLFDTVDEDTILMQDDIESVSMEVKNKRKRKLLCKSRLMLYKDKLVIKPKRVKKLEIEVTLEHIEGIAMYDRNKIELKYGLGKYHIVGGDRFNALKYIYTMYHRRNVEGMPFDASKSEDKEFLGL